MSRIPLVPSFGHRCGGLSTFGEWVGGSVMDGGVNTMCMSLARHLAWVSAVWF